MLSTHMQRSQVEELSAQIIHCAYLTLPYLTLSEFHSTATCSSGGHIMSDSGQCAVYLGNCLCTVLTGAPQAAVETPAAAKTDRAKPLLSAICRDTFGWWFVCGRRLPFWRTVFWYDLGPQVL